MSPSLVTNGDVATVKTAEVEGRLASVYNEGGFDMICSGREKIETPEQFKQAEETTVKLEGLGFRNLLCLLAILVELFKHPHLLLLQIRNSIFKLPGGRLRPGESSIWTDNIRSATVAI
ncbi:hypothetical protein CRYUN_Cryun08bG0049100 [Craigia yunnanensis]